MEASSAKHANHDFRGQQVQFDKSEYGVGSQYDLGSIEFVPQEIGIIDKYVDDSVLYNQVISGSKIYLVKEKNNSQVKLSFLANFEQNVVKKIIAKDKLLNDVANKFAKQECIIHSQMNHQNVVKLYDYTETDD